MLDTVMKKKRQALEDQEQPDVPVLSDKLQQGLSSASQLASSAAPSSPLTSTLSGAGAGAGLASLVSKGSAAAPIGAAIGAGVGILGSIAAKKQRKKEIQARSIERQGEIAQQTASQQQTALANIMEGFRSALLR